MPEPAQAETTSGRFCLTYACVRARMRETWSTTARRLNTPTRRLWEEGFDRFYGILQFVVRKSVANPRSWLNHGVVQRHGKIAPSAEIRRSYTDADPPCKRCWGSFSVRFAHRKLRGRHNGIAKPHMLRKSTGFSLGGGGLQRTRVYSQKALKCGSLIGAASALPARRGQTIPAGPPAHAAKHHPACGYTYAGLQYPSG